MMVEVGLWYNWEVELPELAYRLDVDEMEDGGVSRPSPGFLAVMRKMCSLGSIFGGSYINLMHFINHSRRYCIISSRDVRKNLIQPNIQSN